MVGTGSVADDVDAPQGHVDVLGAGSPQLLAGFASDGGPVRKGEAVQTEGGVALAVELGEQIGREEDLLLLMVGGGASGRWRSVAGKVSALPVVAIVGHGRLGPYQQYVPVVTQHAAIVPEPTVQYGHAKVAEQIIGGTPLQQLGQTLPAVRVGVAFQKVILAAVAAQFQLGTEAVGGTGVAGLGAGLQDPLEVAGKVQRPLVQVARGDGDDGRRGVVVQ